MVVVTLASVSPYFPSSLHATCLSLSVCHFCVLCCFLWPLLSGEEASFFAEEDEEEEQDTEVSLEPQLWSQLLEDVVQTD